MIPVSPMPSGTFRRRQWRRLPAPRAFPRLPRLSPRDILLALGVIVLLATFGTWSLAQPSSPLAGSTTQQPTLPPPLQTLMPTSGPTHKTGTRPAPVATATPGHAGTPAPMQHPAPTLAQDTFARGNQNGWGRASDGQIWQGDASNPDAFGIERQQGTIEGQGPETALLGAPASNVEVQATGTLQRYGPALNFGVVARWNNGGTFYKAYLDGAHLALVKDVAGSITLLGQTPFVIPGGTLATIHLRAQGTTLQASAWMSGTPAPMTWQMTTTDRDLVMGQVGIRVLVGQDADALITAFQARRLP